MKKIFLTIAIAALFTVNVFAADGGKKEDGSANVSYTALSGFNYDFADAANVVWTTTQNFQKATFTVNGVQKTAFYNANGEFLGLTQNVDNKAIPAKALKQINEQYKGYQVGQVIVFQPNIATKDDADQTSYFVFVNLKNDKNEVLVRINDQANIEYFQDVR